MTLREEVEQILRLRKNEGEEWIRNRMNVAGDVPVHEKERMMLDRKVKGLEEAVYKLAKAYDDLGRNGHSGGNGTPKD
jgi:hypothetical protein